MSIHGFKFCTRDPFFEESQKGRPLGFYKIIFMKNGFAYPEKVYCFEAKYKYVLEDVIESDKTLILIISDEYVSRLNLLDHLTVHDLGHNLLDFDLLDHLHPTVLNLGHGLSINLVGQHRESESSHLLL